MRELKEEEDQEQEQEDEVLARTLKDREQVVDFR